MILHDPVEFITLTNTSSALRRFAWTFQFGQEVFRIRKAAAVMLPIKGPGALTVECVPPESYTDDATIEVAQVAVKNGAVAMTVLDFNLKRLNIDDLKGFEVVIILAVFLMIDIWRDEGHEVMLEQESDRVDRFKKPQQALEDVARWERIAAEDRQESIRSTGGRLGKLLRRKSTVRLPGTRQLTN